MYKNQRQWSQEEVAQKHQNKQNMRWGRKNRDTFNTIKIACTLGKIIYQKPESTNQKLTTFKPIHTCRSKNELKN